MYCFFMGYCSAALLVHFFARQPGVLIAISVGILSLGCAVSLRRFGARRAALLCALLGWGIGLFHSFFHIEQHINEQQGQFVLGEPVSVSGRICDLPVSTRFGTRFTLCSEHGKLRLHSDLDLPNLIDHPCLQAEAKMKAPRAPFNPWVGSYEQHLFSKRIVAVGSAHQIKTVPCTRYQQIASSVTRTRFGIQETLQGISGDLPHYGLIEALVLGERGSITSEHRGILRASGTQHLMAISGLHVGLVCWALYLLTRRVLSRSLCLIVVGLGGLIYVALVGFSPSAQRAYVMVLCALLVVGGVLPRNYWRVLLLALFVVLLLDPLASLNLGFWFSFWAVAVLILVGQCWPSLTKSGVLMGLLVVQCILIIALAPMQSHLGWPISAHAIASNLVAIPWISLCVLPLVLMATLASPFSGVLAGVMFSAADEVLGFLLAFLEPAMRVTLVAEAPSIYSPVALLLLGFIGVVLLFSVMRWFAVCLLGFCLIWLFTPADESIDRDARSYARFTVIDAGQGLSLVVDGKAITWIYDTGPAYEYFSTAESVLLPYVEPHVTSDRPVGLIASHGDNDHAGAFALVQKRMNPDVILLGEPERTGIDSTRNMRRCVAPQTLTHGKLTMRVLWPLQGVSMDTYDSNSRSCVVKFSYGNFSVLVMGDVEGRAEREIIRYYRAQHSSDLLRADVLVAGHHGARAATNMSLLKHVKPRFVVISAGYGNRFGHPHGDVLRRIERVGSTVLKTYEDGALVFDLHSDALRPLRTRPLAEDYWISP